MRPHAGFAALAASLILAAGSATAVAEEPASHTGGEVWPGHAASDHEVAREGRAAMPFTIEQIEALGRLLRETQGAASLAADPPPEGRIRRVRIGSPGEGAIPAIAVRKGYVTAISFTDATGAPWPIEEVLVDGRFLPEAVLPSPAETGGEDGGGSGHLLYLVPQARSLHGNALIKLRELAEPLVASLRGGGATTDFRVEVRLGMPGPNARPGTVIQAGFHAGDQVLLDLLGGVAPPGAERLKVEGGGPGARAWRHGGDLLLATRADLLSPGPWAAERGAGGRWAYRLPGDAMMLAGVGFVLGPLGLGWSLLAGSVCALVHRVWLQRRRGRSFRRGYCPLGPGMVAGAMMVFLFVNAGGSLAADRGTPWSRGIPWYGVAELLPPLRPAPIETAIETAVLAATELAPVRVPLPSSLAAKEIAVDAAKPLSFRAVTERIATLAGVPAEPGGECLRPGAGLRALTVQRHRVAGHREPNGRAQQLGHRQVHAVVGLALEAHRIEVHRERHRAQHLAVVRDDAPFGGPDPPAALFRYLPGSFGRSSSTASPT